MEDLTKRAIELAGGPARVAEAIRRAGKPITPQAVSQWKRVPDVHVRLVEGMTGGELTRYQIRPDIFGQPEAENC